MTMTRSDGKCRVDGVEVGEVRIHMFGTPSLFGKYALTESGSGSRFGAGRRNQQWSEATWTKAKDLIESMERDIAKDVFEESSTTDSMHDAPATIVDEIPSL
jgi:hypothetical protein